MVLRKPSSLKHNSPSSARTPNMQARNSSSTSDRNQDGSDTDDWTLVTPPQSKSGSPERQATPSSGQGSGQDESNAAIEQSAAQAEPSEQPDNEDSSNNFEEVALNDDNENISPQEAKPISSAKRRVRIATEPIRQEAHSDRSKEPTFLKNKPDAQREGNKISAAIIQKAAKSAAPKSSRSQPSAADRQTSPRSTRAQAERSGSLWPVCGAIFIGFAVSMSFFCVFSLGYMLGQSGSGSSRSRESLRKILNSRDGPSNLVYLDPSDHAFSRLKLLDDELLECIQRQNPRHEIDYNPDLADSTPRSKPIMGLVCYEKEAEWRKKFHKLKFEHNFNIWKTLKRVRQQLTNEMLEIYHPGLRFMLITNQLDWLNRLDSERRDRELERLKAEVHELRRAHISPTRSRDASVDSNRTARQAHSAAGQQSEKIQSANHALISLQAENRRLRSENGMLRQSLGEKAGTIYIKQSIELEKCERENNAMRQFHLQVAQEVSKGLKQIDLQITDFGAIRNEQEETLSARLNQTRGYLMRLVEETSQLAARNKSFEAELNEARLLNALVVREAQNLVEDDQAAANRSDQEIGIAKAAEQEIITSNEAAPSNLTAEQLRQLDNFRCSGTSECLATKVNWLMKRAKLRERLRKTQSKSGDMERLESRAACHTKHCAHDRHKMWRRGSARDCLSSGSSRSQSCEVY